MPRKKNPGSAGTLRGTSKRKRASAASDATYHQKRRPDIEAIFGACREARDADASRRARGVAKVRAAALALRHFRQNEIGHWVHECPDCQQTLALRSTVNGDVRASSSGVATCPLVRRIQQWLRDNGFLS